MAPSGTGLSTTRAFKWLPFRGKASVLSGRSGLEMLVKTTKSGFELGLVIVDRGLEGIEAPATLWRRNN